MRSRMPAADSARAWGATGVPWALHWARRVPSWGVWATHRPLSASVGYWVIVNAVWWVVSSSAAARSSPVSVLVRVA
ncbi:hypothetical protein [Streptomyces sp. NPDC059816]|uniref:hypothetical protein n=1 Tax=Streptomyces sp. NPDC059816 TaxID=3346960 RepID=UPI00364704C6